MNLCSQTVSREELRRPQPAARGGNGAGNLPGRVRLRAELKFKVLPRFTAVVVAVGNLHIAASSVERFIFVDIFAESPCHVVVR